MLQRIRDSQVRATAPSRKCSQIGPFIAMLSEHDDLPWINYAVPTRPLGGELSKHLDDLEAFFRASARAPRFEFLSELAPELENALLARGYKLQGNLPMMVCDEQSFTPAYPIDAKLVGPEGDLLGLAKVTMKAFGATDDPKPEEVENTRAGMLAGRTHGAVGLVNGSYAGGAYTVGDQEICELAGVGTLPEFRRMGVASAVSSTLMAEHFKTPEALVWLSAGDDVARVVYEKLGFRLVTTQLNYIQDN